MSLSACLVCRFAKRASAGQVVCRLDDSTHETMHVCLAFVGLWISDATTLAASVSGPGSYVIPGQTLTGESR